MRVSHNLSFGYTILMPPNNFVGSVSSEGRFVFYYISIPRFTLFICLFCMFITLRWFWKNFYLTWLLSCYSAIQLKRVSFVVQCCFTTPGYMIVSEPMIDEKHMQFTLGIHRQYRQNNFQINHLIYLLHFPHRLFVPMLLMISPLMLNK